jgi:hypothetical protein
VACTRSPREICVSSAVTGEAFDIHAELFGDRTGLDEEAVDDYERNLAQLFEESREGQAVAAQGVAPGFARTIVHYLLRYEGVSVPEMTGLAPVNRRSLASRRNKRKQQKAARRKNR